MSRVCVGSFVGLMLLMAGTIRAADTTKASTDHQAKDRFHATVTKVDSRNDKITVKMTDKDGKQSEKTLDLGKNVEIMNASGKNAKAEDLREGDEVFVTENNGQVTKISQENAAEITKVDSAAGTVTVKMKDENGKDVSKVFHLMEDAEYADSSGHVATLDVFKAGDQVLFVEGEGKIQGLRKSSKSGDTSVGKRNDQSTTKK